MIVLFTDFGLNGPYLGQVENVLYREAPETPVINLIANAPAHNAKAGAYLLAAYMEEFSEGSVFFAVVDPGVGGDRVPGVLEADGRWFIGPGNGLFELIIRRAKNEPQWWEIRWRPERLSATFHGRDLFAPIAGRIALGESLSGNEDFSEAPLDGIRRPDWPDDLAEVIYIDDFGNAVTGIRASTIPGYVKLSISGETISKADTFSDVSPGEVFWYENANGLLEVSVNQGKASEKLKLNVGSQVSLREM